jgi:hypothetical protein
MAIANKSRTRFEAKELEVIEVLALLEFGLQRLI